MRPAPTVTRFEHHHVRILESHFTIEHPPTCELAACDLFARCEAEWVSQPAEVGWYRVNNDLTLSHPGERRIRSLLPGQWSEPVGPLSVLLKECDECDGSGFDYPTGDPTFDPSARVTLSEMAKCGACHGAGLVPDIDGIRDTIDHALQDEGLYGRDPQSGGLVGVFTTLAADAVLAALFGEGK